MSNNQSSSREEDIKAYQIIRGEIQFEYALMSNRVTWLITTQAFLFTAYAVALRGNNLKDSLYHPAIPILGSFISIILYSSIYAAISRVKLWQKNHETLNAKLADWLVYQPQSPKAAFWGLVPPVLLPAAFLYVWLHFLDVNNIVTIIVILILILLVLSEFWLFTFVKR
ncbi:hypothetical protein [Merismopedia glauca]|uniref:Uncharacterized protein n=1 Tax=Merismopedia glauca CCAP 1448/3 TaxID=1296344 RepID=A0A2T1BYS5_9CYAN|nr:hypothetical protein [Merismopedia glauca]PSB01094.1 hypothetical protein C7B64_20115 [Merismopedia glauca CCAP 1448/3]